MIGETFHDMKIGKNVNTSTIRVSWGYNNQERYIEKNYEFTLGQTNSPDVIDYNQPPPNQPGLWCNFTYNTETRVIEWNGGEKTRDGAEWIKYIADLIQEHGYDLKGTMNWQGEDEDDNGILVR